MYVGKSCVHKCQHDAVPTVLRFADYWNKLFGWNGWNSLPDDVWDPAVECEHFRRVLKTYLFTGRYEALVH